MLNPLYNPGCALYNTDLNMLSSYFYEISNVQENLTTPLSCFQRFVQ